MLREFEIYTRTSTAPVAIKRGICIPGFLFSFIWAFIRGLWLQGSFVLLLLSILVIFAVGESAVFGGYHYISWILSIAIKAYVGVKGNHWRRSKLEREGYSFSGRIKARSAKDAISAYFRGDIQRP